ncbi:MAG: hypothetical protein FWH03_04415 [Firmicutes bacterium]|nr:hypothetical protein [Bacillota bacterium]
MIINAEHFLKDPEKYLNDGAVIMSAEEYERYEELKALEIVRQRKADLDSGAAKLLTHEEVFSALDAKIAELHAKK